MLLWTRSVLCGSQDLGQPRMLRAGADVAERYCRALMPAQRVGIVVLSVGNGRTVNHCPTIVGILAKSGLGVRRLRWACRCDARLLSVLPP